MSDIKKLPDRYTKSNILEFERFFKRYGQYVVTAAYVGGSVEVTFRSESSETSEDDEKSRGGSAGIKIPGVVGFEASGKKPTLEQQC